VRRVVPFVLVANALFACLIYGQSPATAPTKETEPKYTFEFAGRTRAYHFFIPNDEGALPVVVLLHGSGHNGQVMVDAWKDLASKEHFIILAPDSYDPSGWAFKIDSPEFLRAAVEQVKAKHPIDASRVYLFGHSAGAVHALVMAIVDSRYYAAAAVHAGAIPPGYEKLLFSKADRRIPIAIWVGDKDPLFHVDAVTATKRLFETNGFPVELSVIPNHDHDYYLISDLVNNQAWEFLKKAQTRNSGSASAQCPWPVSNWPRACTVAWVSE
jgi:poly(3-hydroxybutyrate) depolymerase